MEMSSIEERIRAAVQPYRASDSIRLQAYEARPPKDHRPPRTPRAERRRPLAVLLAAAALVVGTTVAVAGVRAFTDETPSPLQRAIDDLFGAGRCVTGDEATANINAELVALGYADWVVEPRPGAGPDDCVAAGFVASKRQVVLVPVSGPAVARGLEGIAETLMNECFDRDQAEEFITSTLTGLGVTDFTITTEGPLDYPLGQQEEVSAHIAAGCYVYSGMGRDADGRPIYIIHGRGD
jgi:hypothetical protein